MVRNGNVLMGYGGKGMVVLRMGFIFLEGKEFSLS